MKKSYIIGLACLVLITFGACNAPSSSNKTATSYSLAEVEKHASASDCWTTIDGKIYNITAYVPNHPGGEEEIMKACGKDGSKLFKSKEVHEEKNAQGVLNNYVIGDLKN